MRPGNDFGVLSPNPTVVIETKPHQKPSSMPAKMDVENHFRFPGVQNPHEKSSNDTQEKTNDNQWPHFKTCVYHF